MKSKLGKSFVMIMVITAISALLLRIVVKQIIRMTMAQNESHASATLKLISAALENYARDNHGVYPTSIPVLTQTKPPYLDKDYIKQFPLRGYEYSCSRLEPSGYSCSANPVKCKLTGSMVYNVITGGSLISEGCSKSQKE